MLYRFDFKYAMSYKLLCEVNRFLLFYFFSFFSYITKKALIEGFIYQMVTRTGFEPVNACVKGM